MVKASDKRKHPRVTAKNVSGHVNFAEKSNPCTITNISAGGMLVETTETIPSGMPVAVNLAQPGWTRVLRLPGRVVWALAPKTAARKGQPPGMRIRFDVLDGQSAEMLLELLHTLGIGETPPPERVPDDTTVPRTASSAGVAAAAKVAPVAAVVAPAKAPSPKPVPVAPMGAPDTVTLPGPKTQIVSLSDIVASISRVDVPAVAAKGGAALRAGSSDSVRVAVPDTTLRSADREASTTDENPIDAARFQAQLRGLTLQLNELQETLDERERELREAQDALRQKTLALEKADRERRAAETAIQRLSMQLASRR